MLSFCYENALKLIFTRKVARALGLILKVRAFGTRQWPISLSCMDYLVNKSLFTAEALVVRAKRVSNHGYFGVFKECCKQV